MTPETAKKDTGDFEDFIHYYYYHQYLLYEGYLYIYS